MIENLKKKNDRNVKLSKMTEKDLDNLYLRVFNSEDGELVVQDLANRSFVFESTAMGVGSEYNEGMRVIWLSIQSRLQGAVNIKQEVASDV